MDRKWFILVLVLFLCTSCKEDINKSFDNEKNVIDSIISNDTSFDRKFLEYIYDEYGIDKLKRINDYFKNNSYSDKVWHEVTGNSLLVLEDLYNKKYDNMNNVKILDNKENTLLSFVGDISLADNFDIMPYYDSRGKGVYGILSTEVVDRMKSSDIMIANNEFAITNSNNRINKLYNFKARPERLNIYEEMGIDLVSTANNHIYDYGEEGLLDSIKYLNEYDIPNVGAGENKDAAEKAFYFIVGGYKISFLSATRAEKNVVTPNAEEDKPGTFWVYNPDRLVERIKEEKNISDLVVILIHWGREDSHALEDIQKDTGKLYIDAGADLVVGAHAHVLQGFEIYNNKLIAYNLGDFIFNRETKDTGILSVNIDSDGNIDYYFIPCKQENYYTYMLDGEEKNNVINKINNYSINTLIDEDGKIYQK